MRVWEDECVSRGEEQNRVILEKNRVTRKNKISFDSNICSDNKHLLNAENSPTSFRRIWCGHPGGSSGCTQSTRARCFCGSRGSSQAWTRQRRWPWRPGRRNCGFRMSYGIIIMSSPIPGTMSLSSARCFSKMSEPTDCSNQ